MPIRKFLLIALLAGSTPAIAVAAPAVANEPVEQTTASDQRRQHKIGHAVRIAVNQVGDPYVYGTAGPSTFDCSGLTSYAYHKAGLRKVPRTADQQYHFTRQIKKSNHRRGDLAFYHDSSGHVYHVAMFTGKGRRIVEAARTGTDVRVQQMWDAPWYAGTLRH
jgi:cell wall-associated NlpC family hydrolase